MLCNSFPFLYSLSVCITLLFILFNIYHSPTNSFTNLGNEYATRLSICNCRLCKIVWRLDRTQPRMVNLNPHFIFFSYYYPSTIHLIHLLIHTQLILTIHPHHHIQVQTRLDRPVFTRLGCGSSSKPNSLFSRGSKYQVGQRNSGWNE